MCHNPVVTGCEENAAAVLAKVLSAACTAGTISAYELRKLIATK